VPELDLKRRRLEYRQNLENALESIIYQFSEMPEILKVVLFGSYAAGRRDLFTDLDLIVVMDTSQDFIHRTTELYRKLQTKVDLDLLVYTPDEFEDFRENGFLSHAIETGKVIYEKKRA